MAPMKNLTVSLLLFFWAGCLHMPNNAHGVNSQEEKSDEEVAVGDHSTDEELDTIQERMMRKRITVYEIETISSEIWKAATVLEVKYARKPNEGDKRMLFDHSPKANNDKAVDPLFKNLFQFYEKTTGYEDPCVKSKRRDCDAAQDVFLNHIFNGDGPISILHGYLNAFKIYLGEYDAFKRRLKTIWFKPYSRSGGVTLDTSAFEHVFLGERDYGKVVGLHNWMRMYDEENPPNNFKLTKAPYFHQNIGATVQFQWHDSIAKPTQFFTRTSPATEIALYTLCFMTQPDKRCQINLGGTQMHLQTYTHATGLIGSAFPVFP